MKQLIGLLFFFLILLFAPTIIFATSTAMSAGTLSVDWSQDSEVFNWDPSAPIIYGGNGADAIWGTENFTLVDGNRVYDQHVKDYGGPGWVDTLDQVTFTSSASYGTTVLGEASTTASSVSSSAEVTNDGEGLTLNASGTSHLVRDFKLLTEGEFSFDANYVFSDSVGLEDTETADWYHHANLLLRYFSGDG